MQISYNLLCIADELPYILVDENYASKYRSDLKSAVLRAKARPWALLEGYDICIASHVQPPTKTLASIVVSAGGQVSLENPMKLFQV